jgi:hypothetical protein
MMPETSITSLFRPLSQGAAEPSDGFDHGGEKLEKRGLCLPIFSTKGHEFSCFWEQRCVTVTIYRLLGQGFMTAISRASWISPK